jgi:hypothetical protein
LWARETRDGGPPSGTQTETEPGEDPGERAPT